MKTTKVSVQFMTGPEDGRIVEQEELCAFYVTPSGIRYEPVFDSGKIGVNSRGEVLVFVVCCETHTMGCGVQDICCDRCINLHILGTDDLGAGE